MKTRIWSTITVIGYCLLVIVMAACSDQFLEDKKNYDNVTPDIYNYYEGANARLSDLYAWSLPQSESTQQIGWKYPSYGAADEEGKSTEEYSGFGSFVDPQKPLSISNNNVPDYFYGQLNNIQEAAYGRIRNINDFITGLEAVTPGTNITQAQINQLLGQAYFLRAWCYYRLVQWFGGVPIVKEILEPVESVSVPRSSTKACIDFIVSDLDKAVSLLGSTVWSGNDFGRVTAGTACALKGRVLLLWASPIFNRQADFQRYKDAYAVMKNELATINACGYGLYTTSSNVNGSDFAGLFSQTVSNEAVFTVQYNSTQSGTGQKNNQWERAIRPKNTSGNGSLHPSKMLIDLFPMADGKLPNLSATTNTYNNSYTKLEKSTLAYDETFPMANRDPRFYRTFAFPGVKWAYSGNSTLQTWMPGYPAYGDGKDYALWSYVWYTKADDQGNVESSNSYAADSLLTNNSSWYIRKRSIDRDVKSTAGYVFNATVSNGGFTYSNAPFIELRYAEVLLNLAEAACGAGEMAEAVSYLRQIRQRVGYTGDCGLSAALESDQAACMSAVLYERMIELAYEGKRFHDLRRWLLFDGGTKFNTIEGAPASWTLGGAWANGTCEWLGITPLNNQRREGSEYRTADRFGVGSTTADSDPLKKGGVVRCDPVDLSSTTVDLQTQIATLKTWYDSNLVYKMKKGDGYDSNHVPLNMSFLPRYYLFGFSQGSMNNNTKLPQTIGWEDTNQGGMGTFDPLAE
ncbi:MAG: RagB/SusD family nutrient uptake outer membrane protein [Prevotella sp.]|nr:RagB/SusD family nutrient uptake outer membrane protein [Prevotella sp.]